MATERITIIVREDGSRVVQRNLENIGRSGDVAARGVRFLTQTLAALGIAASARELIQLADSFTNINNKLKLVTTSSQNLTRVNDELFQSAQRTRSSYEGTVELYARVARNADSLGLSQRDVLGITESVNQAIQISGATATEASAGVLQFGQALGSGVLRGDELNSVMENMPRLAQAIAQGMGVSIGQLRKLGADGELTAQKVIAALQKTAPQLAAEFSKLEPTIASSFQVLSNSALKFIGELDKGYGISTKFAQGVLALANNFETLAKVMLVAAAAFAPAAIVAGIGMVAAAVGALGLMLLANPIFAIAGVLAAAAAAAYLFGDAIKVTGDGVTSLRDVVVAGFQIIWEWIQSVANFFVEAWNSAFDWISSLWQTNSETATSYLQVILDFARGVVNTYIGLWVGAINSVIGAWDLLPAAIKDVFTMAWNGAISVLQLMVRGVAAGVTAIINAWNGFPAALQATAARAMSAFVSIVQSGIRIVMQAIASFFTWLGSAATLVGAENPFAGLINPDKALAGISAVKDGLDATAKSAQSAFETATDADKMNAWLESFKGDVSGAAQEVSRVVQDEFGKSLGTDYVGALTGKATDGLNAVLTRAQAISRERIAAQKDQDLSSPASLNAANGPASVLADIGGGGGGGKGGKSKLSEELEAQKKLLEEIRGPALDYQKNITALQNLLDSGKITVDEYNQKFRDLRITFLETQQTLGAGMERAFLKIAKDAGDAGKQIEDLISNAFKGAEDALVEFVTTGKFDFKKLIDSIISDLARLVIRQTIIAPLANALSGVFGGLFQGIGAATGGGGSVGQTGLGFATAGGFTIPGSPGAVDTVPVSFMASPGERVSVTRPGEAEQTQSKTVQTVQVNVVNNGQPVKAQATSTQQPDGTLQIDVLMEQIEDRVAGRIAKGGTSINKSIEGRYGLDGARGIQK